VAVPEVQEERPELPSSVLYSVTRPVPPNPVRVFPAPPLRMKAKPVEEFDSGLDAFSRFMADTVVAFQGYGLAANQVGVLQRVVAIRNVNDLASGQVMILANPEIVMRSEETSVDMEGCLSLPGINVPVERHNEIVVTGQYPPDGEDTKINLGGLLARVAQHEIDHLDGVLMLDHVPAKLRREAVRMLAASKDVSVGMVAEELQRVGALFSR
jgi:peptide deformylase